MFYPKITTRLLTTCTSVVVALTAAASVQANADLQKMTLSHLTDPVTQDLYTLCRVTDVQRSDAGTIGFVKYDQGSDQRLCYTRKFPLRQNDTGSAVYEAIYAAVDSGTNNARVTEQSFDASDNRTIATVNQMIKAAIEQPNAFLPLDAGNGKALNLGNGEYANLLCRANNIYKTLGYLSAAQDGLYYCYTMGYTNPDSSFTESSFSIIYSDNSNYIPGIIAAETPTNMVDPASIKEVQFHFGEMWANNSTSSVEFKFDVDLDTMVITYPPGTIDEITSIWGANFSLSRDDSGDTLRLVKKPEIDYQVTQIGFNLKLQANIEFRSLSTVDTVLNGEVVKIINNGIKADQVAEAPLPISGFDPFPKTLDDQVVTRYSGSRATHKTFQRPTYTDEQGNQQEYLIGGYYTDWGVYPDTSYTPNQLPVNNLNFIQVSFAAICSEGDANNWFGNESATAEAKPKIVELCAGKPTGTMIIPDHFAHYAKADMNLPEWERKWYEPAYHVPDYMRFVRNPFTELPSKAFFNVGDKQLVEQDGYDFAWGLKSDLSHYDRVLNRHGKNFNMYLSIGGWTLSDPFPVIAANPGYRAAFIASVMNYLKLNRHISGIDLDWEFVGVDGAKAGAMGARDTNNHTKLVYELRRALDQLGSQNGTDYQLTAAIGTAPKHLSKVNWNSVVIDGESYPGIADMLDHIFMMSYDYYGAWDTRVGHHTALYNNGELVGHSVDSAVQYLKGIGVNSRKIVIGYAGYGRLWANVQASPENSEDRFTFPNQSLGIHPGEIGTVEAANVAWRHIKATAYDSAGQLKPGYVFVRDNKAKAEHLVATNLDDNSKNVVVTLDTPWSVQQKAEYVKNQQLGGMFTWALDNDNGDLLNAAHAGLGSRKLFDTMKPSARENSLILYRSKEAEYCSNPNIKFQYGVKIFSNIILDFYTFGGKSLIDALQSTADLLSAALSTNKSVHDLTDAEWQEYFDLLQQAKNMDGTATSLDMSKLNKTDVISAASDAGKSFAFIGADLLFSPPVIASFGLSAAQDAIWDAITPPHEDYCGRITRDTLNPWEQIGKDFPSLKANFGY